MPFGERIRFYWITEDLDSWCSSRALGCYYPGTRVIVGTGHSATHEIVHAVLNADAQTNLFLEEALAEHFSGVGIRRPNSKTSLDPSELLWISPTDYRFGELDYAVAQHFVAYIYSRFGSGTIRSLTNVVITGAGPPDLETAFERFTDIRYADLEALYFRESHGYYPGLRDSDIPEIPHIPTTSWTDVSLRCSEATTYGPLVDVSPGMYRTLRLVLKKPRIVELEFAAPEDVELTLLNVDAELRRGRILDFFHPHPTGRFEHPKLRGSETVRLQLEAGTHLLMVSREGYESADAFLGIELVEFPRE